MNQPFLLPWSNFMNSTAAHFETGEGENVGGLLWRDNEQLDEVDELLTTHSLQEIAESIREPRHFLVDLINYTKPSCACMKSAYGGLWIREATSRAQSLLDLFLLLETEAWRVGKSSINSQLDQALARSLISLYRSLDYKTDDRAVPCSRIIRALSSGLVELFAPAFQTLKIELEMIPISLSAMKRRALVLIVNELVTSSISGASKGGGNGRIYLSLESSEEGGTRLTVDNNGSGMCADKAPGTLTLVCQLAKLLDGEVIIRRSNFGGTKIEVDFPAEA